MTRSSPRCILIRYVAPVVLLVVLCLHSLLNNSPLSTSLLTKNNPEKEGMPLIIADGSNKEHNNDVNAAMSIRLQSPSEKRTAGAAKKSKWYPFQDSSGHRICAFDANYPDSMFRSKTIQFLFDNELACCAAFGLMTSCGRVINDDATKIVIGTNSESKSTSSSMVDDDNSISNGYNITNITSWPPRSGEVNLFIKDYRYKNPAQALLSNNRYKRQSGLRLNLTMGCKQNQAYGSGNALARVYAARLVAIATQSAFSFRCNDLPKGGVNNDDLCSLLDGNLCLLQQFEIDTPTPESTDILLPHVLPMNVTALLTACEGRFPHDLPDCLGNISQPIVRDMQRIAQRAEMKRGIQRDDVVIHFRCGDALNYGDKTGNVTKTSVLGGMGGDSSGMGLLPHGYYNLIAPMADEIVGNISIVTQPFHPKDTRGHDRRHTGSCMRIVRDLQQYLQQNFPNAAGVYIRNDPRDGESSFTAFVRLVLARKAAFCGPSTFCTMAVLGTLAEHGYIFAKVPWPKNAVKIYDNIEFVRGGPLIRPRGLNIGDLLEVLRDTEFQVVS